jgi:hypothetical protein
MEKVLDFEAGLQESYQRMKKNHRKIALRDVQVHFANLRVACAKRKKELTKDKDILLNDKPKPPNKGMYQAARPETGNRKQHTARRAGNG